MKTETEIQHIKENIKNLNIKIEESKKDLYVLYKRQIRQRYDEIKKDKEESFTDFLQERISNLYFLAYLGQSDFSMIQIDAEIFVTQELIEMENKKTQEIKVESI